MPTNNLKIFEDSVKGKSGAYLDFAEVLYATGDFKKLTGINVLIKSIRNLLITPIGSYPWDPDYGSNLYKKVWEPLDNISQQEIYREVYDRIKMYDDRVGIESVDISKLNDNKGYQVSLVIKYEGEKIDIDIQFHKQHGMGLE
jgi:phage baseplate assembly protein W